MADPLIRRILAFVEFADGEPDMSYAMRLAGQLGAELSLLAVIDTPAMVSLIGREHERGKPSATLTDSVVQDAKEILQRYVDAAADQGVRARGHAIVSEEVPEQILKEAMIQHADLIVVRSHGRSGFLKALFGSTVQDVLSAAPCPVLVGQA